MPAPTGKKDACRALYAQGLSGLAIAKKLGISRGTVESYKKQDRGTEQDWEKLRADLKGKAPRPNLVSFDRPRGGNKSTTPKAPVVAPDDMDLIALVNGAIVSVAAQLHSADNLQGVGGAASGLVALAKFKLELESEEDALQKVLERYKSPRELAAKLRELGWGKETA